MSPESKRRYVTGFPLDADRVELEPGQLDWLLGLSEKQLNAIGRLVLGAADRRERLMAGVLLGMTPKARAAWIEARAT